MPLIQRPEQFEYAFARALQGVLLQNAKKPKIAFTQGHGEPNVVDSPLKAEFASMGTIESLVIGDDPIPSDVDVLVILGPKRSFKKSSQFAIDQFLMNGKSLVALLDYRQQSTVYPNILIKNLTGLESLFENYGVEIVTSQTLIDRTNPSPAPIKRDQNGRVIYSNHPLYTRMVSPAIDHPAVAHMATLIMPMASPMMRTEKADVRLKIDTLFEGPKDSLLATKISRFEPDKNMAASQDELNGYKSIAAMTISGVLTSAYTPKDQPTRIGVMPGSTDSQPRVFLSSGRGDSRILIASSGTRMLSASPNGLTFFKNAVAWASMDASLAGIRARDRLPASLNKTTSMDRTSIRIVSIVGPVVLLFVIGWILTRRKMVL